MLVVTPRLKLIGAAVVAVLFFAAGYQTGRWTLPHLGGSVTVNPSAPLPETKLSKKAHGRPPVELSPTCPDVSQLNLTPAEVDAIVKKYGATAPAATWTPTTWAAAAAAKARNAANGSVRGDLASTATGAAPIVLTTVAPPPDAESPLNSGSIAPGDGRPAVLAQRTVGRLPRGGELTIFSWHGVPEIDPRIDPYPTPRLEFEHRITAYGDADFEPAKGFPIRQLSAGVVLEVLRVNLKSGATITFGPGVLGYLRPAWRDLPRDSGALVSLRAEWSSSGP